MVRSSLFFRLAASLGRARDSRARPRLAAKRLVIQDELPRVDQRPNDIRISRVTIGLARSMLVSLLLFFLVREARQRRQEKLFDDLFDGDTFLEQLAQA